MAKQRIVTSEEAGRYTIRLARADELSLLPAIERAAAGLFRGTVFPALADAPLASAAIDLGRERVWVAVTAGGGPAGFAIAHPLDDCVYLHELDVHPDHARRGLGRRLIAAVADWAAATGAAGVTLSTFRDIPWNGPHYARLGFRPLADSELTPGLRAVRAAEAAGGLPTAARCCMRLDLPSTIRPNPDDYAIQPD